MSIATLYFSNGETLDLHEGDLVWGIRARTNDKQPADVDDKEWSKLQFDFPETTNYNGPFELWEHAELGIIPSLTEVLNGYLFFYKDSDSKTLYSSTNVVKIVNH